ncbi:uncharacterized protein LOC135387622 [Ornithodoros turicata]|uniref:uncharacterized protein LOC135387622 n=1 Tax=Ornithodoros turicata TaxID=34597 RepID=UPI003139BA27
MRTEYVCSTEDNPLHSLGAPPSTAGKALMFGVGKELEEGPLKYVLRKHRGGLRTGTRTCVIWCVVLVCNEVGWFLNVLQYGVRHHRTPEIWSLKTPRGEITAEIWPQKTPRGGMVQEKQPQQFGLRKHQELFILQVERDGERLAKLSIRKHRGEMVQEKQPQQFGLRKHQEEKQPWQFGLRKRQEVEWYRKNNRGNLASENAKSKMCFLFCRWNGTGKTTVAIWPQKTPRGGMVQEKQPWQFGLRKRQEVEWYRKNNRGNLASENAKSKMCFLFCRWNGTGKTTVAIWPQKTPRVKCASCSAGGMVQEKQPWQFGLRKRQEVEWYRKNNRGNLASENAKRWNGTGKTTVAIWPRKTPRG